MDALEVFFNTRAKIDVSCTDNDNATVLHYLLERNEINSDIPKILFFLLNKGVDPTIQSKTHGTILDMLTTFKSKMNITLNNKKTVDELIKIIGEHMDKVHDNKPIPIQENQALLMEVKELRSEVTELKTMMKEQQKIAQEQYVVLLSEIKRLSELVIQTQNNKSDVQATTTTQIAKPNVSDDNGNASTIKPSFF